jgi:hypothetical protein
MDDVDGSAPLARMAPEIMNSVVGMSEDAAITAIEATGLVARVVERDGEALMVTMDYREDRVSLTVIDGVVTAAEARG